MQLIEWNENSGVSTVSTHVRSEDLLIFVESQLGFEGARSAVVVWDRSTRAHEAEQASRDDRPRSHWICLFGSGVSVFPELRARITYRRQLGLSF